MLRKVLWIAAACAAVLVALAVSRSLNFDRPAPKKAPEAATAAVEVAQPAAEVAPEAPPPPVAVKPPPTAEELQVQEDAAATGMTTLEPQEPTSEPKREPAREEPPT
jgi:hypothetical protein